MVIPLLSAILYLMSFGMFIVTIITAISLATLSSGKAPWGNQQAKFGWFMAYTYYAIKYVLLGFSMSFAFGAIGYWYGIYISLK